jgi:hypothetical protein
MFLWRLALEGYFISKYLKSGSQEDQSFEHDRSYFQMITFQDQDNLKF